MQTTNNALIKNATPADFKRLGFTENVLIEDGITRDVSWDMKSKDYELSIDMYYFVKLARKGTDYITLQVDDLSELKDVVDWIAE